MPSSYSPNLRLELIGTGEQAGTWGVTTNTNLGTLIEQAIAGYATVNISDANYTLTFSNGASDQARSMALNITSATALTATRSVFCPTGASKLYIIKNATSGGQSIIVGTATGVGVTVTNGSTAIVFCDGTDTFNASNAAASGVSSVTAGTGINASASTGAVTISNTGVTSLTTSSGLSTNTSATGAVSVTNTGVTGVTAGTGVGVSASTGSVTISNTGVTQITAGSGISVSASTGSVTITNTGGGGGGGITSVTATSPVVSSGGSTPDISLPPASAGVNGYMTSAYATKLDGIAAGATNVTNTNQLTNGAGFVTSSGTVANATNATYATTAGTANAVAWTNVSGRPTNVSAFTNDAGYITAATIPANGAVGNYIYCTSNALGATPTVGSTVPGSSLIYGSAGCCVAVPFGYSGTWRIEGFVNQAAFTPCLFVRVA